MKKITAIFFSLFLFSLFQTMPFAAAFDYKAIYKNRSQAVVLIVAVRENGIGSSGTGSIIREDGLIITNAHVIVDKEANQVYPYLYVYLKPENFSGHTKKELKEHRYNAASLAYDGPLDLALLRLESPPGNLTSISLADPSLVEVGDPVLAIGHPEQGGLWTLTTGVISTTLKDFEGVPGKDVFQTETSLNRGNSGGPLLDIQGNMVGINSNIARQAKDGLTITDINFSINSGVAQKWLAKEDVPMAFALIKKEEPAPAPDSGEKKGPQEEIGPKARKEQVDLKLEQYPAIPHAPEAEAKPRQTPEERKDLWAKGTQLTPKRPYMSSEFYKVEEEMKSMMERMRKSFK